MGGTRSCALSRRGSIDKKTLTNFITHFWWFWNTNIICLFQVITSHTTSGGQTLGEGRRRAAMWLSKTFWRHPRHLPRYFARFKRYDGDKKQPHSYSYYIYSAFVKKGVFTMTSALRGPALVLVISLLLVVHPALITAKVSV
jgi:hypothetical protein